MNEQKIITTMKDIQRYKTIQDVIDKKITGLKAALILGLTNVHVSRLKKKLLEGGFDALLRKTPLIPPNKQVSEQQLEKIIQLRTDVYYDLNINHFKEKLNEKHNIPYSYSTIRKILITHDMHQSRKRRVVHRLRRRMPKAGMLIQMDSSQHNWIPNLKEKWWLIAMIDDATSEVLFAYFFKSDNLFNNMFVIRHCIEKKGLFTSLYVDKASHFTTTRHMGIHYSTNPEQDETQIERALRELDITLIPANSPQAKGRIERLFGVLQDRLIKEMRLAQIKNYQQANNFLLNFFLPDYNARFAIKNVQSIFRPLPKSINLDTVFCVKLQRTVNNDNTIQVYNQLIQIKPSHYYRSFAKRKVEVCITEHNRIFVIFNNKIIARNLLPNDNPTVKKQRRIQSIINQRRYIPQEPCYHFPSIRHL